MQLGKSWCLALIVALSAPLAARAAISWDFGGGADTNWSQPLNWDNNQVPTFPAALSFPFSFAFGQVAHNDLSNVTGNGISFNGTSATLNGNAITLAGNLTNTGPSNSVQTIDLPMALSSSISVTNSSEIDVTKPISGTGSLTITKGLLKLGADNSYSGDTIIYGGAENGTGGLTYTADQTGVHSLVFDINPADTTGSQITADFTAATVTATGLVVKNRVSNDILKLPSAKPLTINGSVDIGNIDPGNSSITSGIQIQGGTGTTLVVNAGSGNLTIGGSSSGFGTSGGTLTNSGTGAGLIFTGNEVRIGGSQAANSGNNSSGTLTLGSQANSITANAITVGGGSSTLASSPVGGTLNLGSGTNTINADTIYIGTQGSNGTITLASSSGTATIRDKAGTGRATIVVGDGTGVTGSFVPTALLNFGNGTADVMASTLTIGKRKSATVTYSKGTIDVTSIQMAPTGGFGTLNVNGRANLIVNSASGPGGGSFSLAYAQGASATGNFNISGGTASVNADIVITSDGQIGALPIGIIKLNGGTLDMLNHNIGGLGQISFTAQKGTLKNLAQLNGGGGLAKSGSSTDVLVLDGVNTYTGTTAIQAGTMLVNGTHTGGGRYTVSSGATLGGAGSTTSAVTVNSGGFLSPGASIESLDEGATTLNGTLQIDVNDADVNVVDLLNVNGTLDISSGTSAVDFNSLGTPTLPAYEFASYGSLTGTQFATVTDLPSGYTINYHYNDGTDSNNIALVAVPEPSSLVLMALGLAPIVTRRGLTAAGWKFRRGCLAKRPIIS